MKKKILILVLISSLAGANSAPELSEAYHTPSWGYPGTNFTFSVTYSDPDGDPPAYISVYIQPPNTEYTEEMVHDMSYVSGLYPDGALYAINWTATSDYVGNLNHYFEASDGTARANKPTYGGNCTPGDCPDCCGDFGGPVVFSGPIDDSGIYLFSRNSSTPLWSYDTGTDWINQVAISADGDYIAAQTYNGSVYFFSKDSSTPLWTHDEEPDGTGSVAISSDGSYIAAGSGSTLYLFSPDNGTPLWSCPMNSTVSSVSISSDGSYIVAGNYDNKLLLFSKDSGTPLWTYEVIAEGGEGGGADVTAAAISADGNYISAGTGCPDRSLYLFSRNGSTPLWINRISTNSPVESISMASDGSYFAVGDGGPDDPTGIYFFGRESNESLWSYTTNGSVISVSISADGERFAAQHDTALYLFSRDGSTPLWTYSEGIAITTVSMSSDGRYTAAGGTDRKILFFSNETNSPVWDYTAAEWIMSLDLSDDGGYLAAGTGASLYFSVENPSGMDPVNATCGDTICEGDETYENCPQDCMGGECSLPGDEPPCDEITLSEVIDLINLWAAKLADLADVIDLINAWSAG